MANMNTYAMAAGAVLLASGSVLAQGNPWKTHGIMQFHDSPLMVGSQHIHTDTSFYTHPYASVNWPVPEFIVDLDADAAFSSYFGYGSGPGPLHSQPYAGSVWGAEVAGSSAWLGGAWPEPGVGAAATLKEVNGALGWAVFLGRMTTVGAGSQIFATDGGAVQTTIGVSLLPSSGPGNSIDFVTLRLNGEGVPSYHDNTYFFVSETTTGILSDGTAIVMHDLYFTTNITPILFTPGPNAIALFALGGLVATRRRRG